MKLEDNFLDELFEKVREEKPHLGYDEVAQSFLTNSSPTLLGIAKGWFLKNISLNSILILAVGSVSIALLWSSFTPEKKAVSSEILNPVTKIELTSSSLQEIEKTVSPVEINSRPTIADSKKEEKIEIIPKGKPIIESIEKPVLATTSITQEKEFPIEIPEAEDAPKVAIKEKVEKENLEKERKDIFFNRSYPEVKINSSSEQIVESNSSVESPWVVGDGAKNPDWGMRKMPARKILSANELAFQKMMDLHYLERIFEKDELGRFLPLTIVGNYYLNQNGWINFKGKRVRIIDEPLAPEFNPKNPHVDITKFRVRKKRATLKFNYKNHSIFIQLKRNGNRWEYHKLKAKKGNEKVVDINF